MNNKAPGKADWGCICGREQEGLSPALNNSSYWLETDRKWYWIQWRQNQCSFFSSFFLYHPLSLVFLFYSRSLHFTNFLFHTHSTVKLRFVCIHTCTHTLSICLSFSLLPLLLFTTLHLSPLLSSSSLCCTHLFFQVLLHVFILPPWLNHRWFTPTLHAIAHKHLCGLYLNLVLNICATRGKRKS